MGTNYKRGYAAERRAVEELVREGYFAVRSAGSKGPFDIIAFGADDVRLIQVKRGSVAGGTLEEARRRLREIQGPFRKELWVWVKRKGFVKEVVE